MFSNNQKIASFYPTTKRNNFIPVQTNKQNNVNNNFNLTRETQNNQMSDSLELALITVNLTYARFKLMDANEIDNYVKTMLFNNSYDSRKYQLALNILLEENNKLQKSYVIKQISAAEQNKSKSMLEEKISFNKIDYSQIPVNIPDEFNLNISSIPTTPLPISTINFGNNTNNDNTSQQTQPFFIRQNKNLDLSTYSGNPLGITKITNNNPINSLRPINKLYDSSTTNVNTTYMTDMTDLSFIDNSSVNSRISNSIIKQTSFNQNPSTVLANGGKRRSSNLDVGSSNNYVIIK